jgi:hypothetical protein
VPGSAAVTGDHADERKSDLSRSTHALSQVVPDDRDVSLPLRARALWALVVIPTACALIPWIVLIVPADNLVTPALLLGSGFLVLASVVLTVVFAFRNSLHASLLPLAPFAVVAVVYLGTDVLTWINSDDSIRWVGEAFLAFFLCLAVQPFLAVVGGLISLATLKRRGQLLTPEVGGAPRLTRL